MRQPESVRSVGGVLDEVLTLEVGSHVANEVPLRAFAFNGTLPGPTLRVKAGDRVRILFQNRLPAQPGARRDHNELGYVDESNLHFHGLHVPAELPSDDTKLVVKPGEDFQYDTVLPQDHMPGTHWIHPHRHGSSALQVGGGAALALIVEDPASSLPQQVESAKEVIMVVQDFGISELNRIAQQSKDTLVWSAPDGPDLMLLNGEHFPELAMDPGEWQRWRVIFAGWRNVRRGALNLAIDCEMKLLAKDGLYISDFPRAITVAAIPAGGRADIMVRCSTPLASYRVTSGGVLIATVRTSSASVASSNLLPWSPSFPDYLQDLGSMAPNEGCSCETSVEAESINDIPFSYQKVLHETFLGAIVERKLHTEGHPYHQHLYPFQLVAGFANSDYFRLGDWHDTFMAEGLTRDPVTMRYKTTHIAGEMMLHCHRLDHEDKGSMALEIINPSGSCACTARSSSMTIVIVAICVGIGLVIALAIGLLCWCRRRPQKISNSGYER